jgi:hypothetical protein
MWRSVDGGSRALTVAVINPTSGAASGPHRHGRAFWRRSWRRAPGRSTRLSPGQKPGVRRAGGRGPADLALPPPQREPMSFRSDAGAVGAEFGGRLTDGRRAATAERVHRESAGRSGPCLAAPSAVSGRVGRAADVVLIATISGPPTRQQGAIDPLDRPAAACAYLFTRRALRRGPADRFTPHAVGIGHLNGPGSTPPDRSAPTVAELFARRATRHGRQGTSRRGPVLHNYSTPRLRPLLRDPRQHPATRPPR